jgi:dUTP pyrophosphatase
MMKRQIELQVIDPRAVVPEYGSEYAAGVDLCAVSDSVIQIPPLKTAMIHTGIKLNMMTVPEHLVALIWPRSGKGAKEGKVIGNLTGVIDEDYHGELMISVWNRNAENYITVEPGEKIAQLVFLPIIRAEFNIVNEFRDNTNRGENGFGSTDAAISH